MVFSIRPFAFTSINGLREEFTRDFVIFLFTAKDFAFNVHYLYVGKFFRRAFSGRLLYVGIKKEPARGSLV